MLVFGSVVNQRILLEVKPTIKKNSPLDSLIINNGFSSGLWLFNGRLGPAGYIYTSNTNIHVQNIQYMFEHETS